VKRLAARRLHTYTTDSWADS